MLREEKLDDDLDLKENMLEMGETPQYYVLNNDGYY